MLLGDGSEDGGRQHRKTVADEHKKDAQEKSIHGCLSASFRPRA